MKLIAVEWNRGGVPTWAVGTPPTEDDVKMGIRLDFLVAEVWPTEGETSKEKDASAKKNALAMAQAFDALDEIKNLIDAEGECNCEIQEGGRRCYAHEILSLAEWRKS